MTPLTAVRFTFATAAERSLRSSRTSAARQYVEAGERRFRSRHPDFRVNKRDANDFQEWSSFMMGPDSGVRGRMELTRHTSSSGAMRRVVHSLKCSPGGIVSILFWRISDFPKEGEAAGPRGASAN